MVHDDSDGFDRVGDKGAAGNADEAKGDVNKTMLRLVEMARRVLVVLRPMMDTIVFFTQTYRR